MEWKRINWRKNTYIAWFRGRNNSVLWCEPNKRNNISNNRQIRAVNEENQPKKNVLLFLNLCVCVCVSHRVRWISLFLCLPCCALRRTHVISQIEWEWRLENLISETIFRLFSLVFFLTMFFVVSLVRFVGMMAFFSHSIVCHINGTLEIIFMALTLWTMIFDHFNDGTCFLFICKSKQHNRFFSFDI